MVTLGQVHGLQLERKKGWQVLTPPWKLELRTPSKETVTQLSSSPINFYSKGSQETNAIFSAKLCWKKKDGVFWTCASNHEAQHMAGFMSILSSGGPESIHPSPLSARWAWRPVAYVPILLNPPTHVRFLMQGKGQYACSIIYPDKTKHKEKHTC